VGGLVWSITASGVSVDIDLIFQENSTIGERIKLSEAIVTCLIAMKCPFPLQPNQIQGLDYDNIFPVVRWLIKNVLENRRLTGDRVRMLAVSQFGRTYEMTGSQTKEGSEFIVETMDQYRPTRKFRKGENAHFSKEQAVEATLLEYGEKTSRIMEDTEAEEKAAEKKEKQGRKNAQTDEQKQKASEARQRKAEMEDRERLEVLQGQLAAAGQEGKVSTAAVGSIITLQSEAIKAMAATYNEEMVKQQQQDVESGAGDSKKALALQFQRQIDNLSKKFADRREKMAEKKATYQAAVDKQAEVQALLDSKKAIQERIVNASAALDEEEKNASAEQKAILNKLKGMVLLNENLKSQEKKFIESCKSQREELLKKLQDLEDGTDDADEETKKMREIEKIHDADLEKLNKITLALAKKNQEISIIQRQIDDQPTRAELLQFERRFVELNDLISDKLIETRKYFNMYNTKDDVKDFMRQECELLNSIIDGFPIASRSKNGQTQYKTQVTNILGGIEKQKDHVSRQYDSEVVSRDTLIQKHTILLERQRAYFKAVKEFQEECGTNERLVAGLESMQKKLQAMQARQQGGEAEE